MSYEILYRKQFIKVSENEFIPMIETGSNNCYDVTNNRRSRDWWADTYITEGKIIDTKENILARIDKIRTDKIESAKESVERYKDDTFTYDDKRFGWHTSIAIYGKGTSGTSFGMFKGYYLTGFKQAMTVEELKEKDVQLVVRMSRYDDEGLKKRGLEKKEDVYIDTTEQLVNTLKEFKEYYGNDFQPFYLTFSNDWGIDRLYRERRYQNADKRRANRKAKSYIHVSVYFVLACKEVAGYFVKNTKRGFRYSPYSTGGKLFATHKDAEKFLNKMRNKDRFEIEQKDTGGSQTVSILV
jgi:hypothetical protein